ncbi:MAG: hypothetical protein RLZZ281_557, partial [Pseudomonadota bacterium]
DTEFPERVQQSVEHVDSALRAIAMGGQVQPLALEHDPRLCEYCSVRGVCRRDEVPYGR